MDKELAEILAAYRAFAESIETLVAAAWAALLPDTEAFANSLEGEIEN